MKFGILVEPNNEAIRQKMEWAHLQREKNCPTIPSTIENEKLTNPFMRVHEQSVMEHAKENDPIKTMAYLKRKNNLKT